MEPSWHSSSRLNIAVAIEARTPNLHHGRCEAASLALLFRQSDYRNVKVRLWGIALSRHAIACYLYLSRRYDETVSPPWDRETAGKH
jgi:hypothetical protein